MFILSGLQGNSKAQGIVGRMYATGDGIPRNYDAAVRWYRLSAEQGSARAQSNLGLMYDQG